MTPATELALQILHTANRYKAEELTTAAVLPNVTQQRLKERLTKNTHLVIGTSGRILELYSRKKMKNVTSRPATPFHSEKQSFEACAHCSMIAWLADNRSNMLLLSGSCCCRESRNQDHGAAQQN